MHKVGLLVVQVVGKLFRVCGVVDSLFSDVKNTSFGGVYKGGVLYKTCTSLSVVVIHPFKICFLSVKKGFIPTIHTTYNKLQLFKLNYLLLITEGSK